MARPEARKQRRPDLIEFSDIERVQMAVPDASDVCSKRIEDYVPLMATTVPSSAMSSPFLRKACEDSKLSRLVVL